MTTSQITVETHPALLPRAKCAQCPHKGTWVSCICSYELTDQEGSTTMTRRTDQEQDDIRQLREDTAAARASGDTATAAAGEAVLGAVDAAEPDEAPDQPGPTGNDAADQRH